MFDQATAEFVKQGLGYLIAFIEGGIIVWFFVRLDAKDKVIENRDQIIMGLQEKRVTDYKENGERLLTTSNNVLTGMQSLKEAAASQTNAITKMLDNFMGRKS